MFRIGRFSEKLQYRYYNEHGIDPDTKEEKVVPRPKIEVAFRKNSSKTNRETNPEIRLYGLVDSGADITFIPKQIAEILKLELKEETKKTSKSASEPFETYRTTTYLEIFYKGRRIPIGEIETAIQVKPTPPEDVEKMILLGRNSVFSEYIITFNESKKMMRFEKIHVKQNFKGRKK